MGASCFIAKGRIRRTQTWLPGLRGGGLALFKLFKPFSSSIKTLSLRASVSSSLGPSAILSFPSLQVLTLIGTIWSGQFIFQHQYSSLQRLDIRVAKCKAELHLNHKDIRRILESCRNSLVSVEMIEWCDEMYGDAADQITESEKSEVLASVPETFSLPQLENLDLCFISSTYQRLYSSLDCPSLNPRTSFFGESLSTGPCSSIFDLPCFSCLKMCLMCLPLH